MRREQLVPKRASTSNGLFFIRAQPGTGDDQIGGIPLGISHNRWPWCGNGHGPLGVAGRLQMHAERLPFDDKVALNLFVCQQGCINPKSRWNAGYIWTIVSWPDNRVARRKPPPKPPLGSTGRPKVLESYALSFEPVVDVSKLTDADSLIGPGLEQPKRGAPFCWVEGCRRKMRAVARFGEELARRMGFGGGWPVHLFGCPDGHEFALLNTASKSSTRATKDG